MEKQSGDGNSGVSSEVYREIFEADEQGVFVHDMDTGEILDVNAKACAIHGYTREEMLRLTVGDFSFGDPPFTQDRAVELVRKAREKPQRFEWLARKKDGQPVWLRVLLKPTRAGERGFILAFVRDISEQKGSEERLAAEQFRLRAMLDALMDPIVAMDADGCISEFNTAAAQFFGYSREEAIGSSVHELIIPERHREAHVRGFRKHVDADGPNSVKRRFEISARRADGSEIPIELTISAVTSTDRPQFIAYIRDLTRRRVIDHQRTELEDRLRRVQTMEAIGQVTASIAADFNEILTEISGNLNMALSRARQTAQDHLGEYLEKASRSTERARELMAQMLTFSQGQRSETAAFETAPLIRDTVKGLRPALPSDVDVKLDFSQRLPAVRFNPVQAAKIVAELCANASEAMRSGGGTITIGLHLLDPAKRRCASCHQRIDRSYLALSVKDQGKGIDPKHAVSRIFEPFFTTKEAGEGSGMGLAMIHGIVHEHGGHILVDSGREGTTIDILLPLAREGAQSIDVGDDEFGDTLNEAELMEGRVLLVDDDPQELESCRILLERWGLEVHSFLDPMEARRWFADQPSPDLVLVDQTMPGISGVDLAAELLDEDPELAIVIFASQAEEDTVRENAPREVLSVLSKPIDPSQLRVFVGAILGSSIKR